MAIDDLTAEQEVLGALFAAHEALADSELSEHDRDEVCRLIRQALKRVQEATAQ